MSHLKKGIIGSLQDAYEALLDGQIICNPKHSPYTDPKFKDIKTYTERINANDVLSLIYKSDEAAKSHINVALHNEGICRQFNIS